MLNNIIVSLWDNVRKGKDHHMALVYVKQYSIEFLHYLCAQRYEQWGLDKISAILKTQLLNVFYDSNHLHIHWNSFLIYL